MAVKVMKVSSKGQVTLPREVRNVLGSDVVTYDVRDGRVLLLPVRDVGGSLNAAHQRLDAYAHIALQNVHSCLPSWT